MFLATLFFKEVVPELLENLTFLSFFFFLDKIPDKIIHDELNASCRFVIQLPTSHVIVLFCFAF